MLSVRGEAGAVCAPFSGVRRRGAGRVRFSDVPDIIEFKRKKWYTEPNRSVRFLRRGCRRGARGRKTEEELP